MSRGAASISVSFHVLSFRRRPFLAPATTPGLGGSQPVVKVQLHSAGDASPLHPTAHSPRRGGPGLTALLLPQIFPIFSVVAPCHRGASPPSVRRRTFTTGCWMNVTTRTRSRSRWPQEQSFVQTAGPIPLQIETDVSVANGLELADDRRRRVLLERARDLGARDFEARELVVMAHAEHAKPEPAKRIFRPLDRAELLVGNVVVIRNPRRQTGGGRFVPRRQAGPFGWRPDLVLCEVHFVERTADAEFARCLPSRPVIAAIVGVVAVDDDGAPFRRDAGKVGVQLVFAVIAAVDRVGTILGSIELACVDDFVAKAEITGNPEGELPMPLGIAGAVGRHGHG